MLAIGPPGCLHCSLSTDHYPLSTLSRCARRHIPNCQGNVSVRSGIRHKQHAGAGGTGGNAVGQGLLHGAAHLAAQFPRTIGGYGITCQCRGSRRGMAQGVALAGGAFFQLAEQAIRDRGQLGGAKRVEQYHIVQAAHQLRAEIIFGFL